MEQETKVEKMVDVNGVSETAPTMCVQRELNAIVDKTKKSIVTCLTEKPDIFDGDIDINEVDHIFVPYAGDKSFWCSLTIITSFPLCYCL